MILWLSTSRSSATSADLLLPSPQALCGCSGCRTGPPGTLLGWSVLSGGNRGCPVLLPALCRVHPAFQGQPRQVRGCPQGLLVSQGISPVARAGLDQDVFAGKGGPRVELSPDSIPVWDLVDVDSHTPELLRDLFPRLTLGVISLQLLHAGLVSLLIQAL